MDPNLVKGLDTILVKGLDPSLYKSLNPSYTRRSGALLNVVSGQPIPVRCIHLDTLLNKHSIGKESYENVVHQSANQLINDEIAKFEIN